MRTRSWWRTQVGVVGAIALLSLSAGCGAPRSQQTRRLDRTVITRQQMEQGNYVSVYDAVAALRSAWLRPRGSDSFVNPSIVWVYVDGARVGDVSALQGIRPQLVNTVRFYDGPTATGLWGVDNGAGVIHVSTWSEGAPGMVVPDSTRRITPPKTRIPDTTARSSHAPSR